MKTSECYLPEGSYTALPEMRQALSSPEGLRRAQDEGMILEAVAQRCTAAHDLLFDFGFAQGIMPRSCCALGVAEGDTREIAILSRVGKPTCFAVTEVDETSDPPVVWLSRTIVQQRAQDFFLDTLTPGDVIPAAVTHLEPFGASWTSAAGSRRSSASKTCRSRASSIQATGFRSANPSMPRCGRWTGRRAAFHSPTVSCSAHGNKTPRNSPQGRPCAAWCVGRAIWRVY